MARSLSKTLNLARFASISILAPITTAAARLTPSSSLSFQSIAVLPRRHKSTNASRAQLIEIEIDSSSDGADAEVLGLKRLEDAIQSIIVQRAAPAWLVFRPGCSYWVPPKPGASNLARLMEKLTNPLTEEESLASTSAIGWPSSSYFLQGNGFPEPVLGDSEVEMDVQCNDRTSQSEDKE